jgi:predicted LPLAT superfamily acyltransferase
VAFDRVYLLSGRLDLFEIDRRGSEHIADLLERKRGALLLGAHFGSFEAMRAVAEHGRLRINILAYGDNARRISALLRRFGGGAGELRVIEIRKDDPTYILEVKERIDEGELVAVLGDRVGLNERSVLVPFLGADARFPTGPYHIAHVLACPVLLVYGVYEAPNRYLLRCEPFAERVSLPRGAREEEAKRLCRRYAARLEALCRSHPDNWFNFFDPWEAAPQKLPEVAGVEARP